MDRLFPRLVAARGFDDADDIAAVLHHRVARATTRPAGLGRTRKAPRLIAGLIPHADGPMADDMRQALERRELIAAHADTVLDTARDENASWTKPLGKPPRDPRKIAVWRRHARTVAGYRDRYGITDDTPLGTAPEATARKIDHARAVTALRHLTIRSAPEWPASRKPVGVEREGPRL